MDYSKPVKIPDGRYFLKVSQKGERIFHQVNNVTVQENLSREVKTVTLVPSAKNLFESIDNEFVSQAEVQKLEWFGKEISSETIRSAYQQSLSPDGSISLSLATIKGDVMTTLYTAQKELTETIPAGSSCDVLLELAGLWFLKRSFGPIWRLVQARVRPGPRTKAPVYPTELKIQPDDPESEEVEEDPTDYLD